MRATRAEAARKEKRKVGGKFLDALELRVAIERSRGAFLCFALGERKNSKGNAGFRSRGALERRVIYTSNLSKQRLRVELRARTLCRPGTYIKSSPQLLITPPALIHLSCRQFGRWTLFTAEAGRGTSGGSHQSLGYLQKRRRPNASVSINLPETGGVGSPRHNSFCLLLMLVKVKLLPPLGSHVINVFYHNNNNNPPTPP